MSASKNQLTQAEKASRWDELIGCLQQPGMRDTYIHHLSGVRRAVCLLLAGQEELPPALADELKAYRVKLDALYLEAADGFPPSRACSTSCRPISRSRWLVSCPTTRPGREFPECVTIPGSTYMLT
jgi:hypothetical protein